MVKGVSRRIVVVDAPDRKLFEQAIFIVRDGAAGDGVSAVDLVREARRVAKDYAVTRKGRRFPWQISPQIAAVLGASAVGAAWLLVTIFT